MPGTYLTPDRGAGLLSHAAEGGGPGGTTSRGTTGTRLVGPLRGGGMRPTQDQPADLLRVAAPLRRRRAGRADAPVPAAPAQPGPARSRPRGPDRAPAQAARLGPGEDPRRAAPRRAGRAGALDRAAGPGPPRPDRRPTTAPHRSPAPATAVRTRRLQRVVADRRRLPPAGRPERLLVGRTDR